MADIAVEPRLEQYRGELTAFCYRMLGSPAEAEDAVQDTMIRAWRAYDRFEGRSQLRSWLYRIATNVCFDLLNGRKKRALPMDLGPARTSADAALGTALPESAWVQPLPDGRTPGPAVGADPGDQAIGRDSIRLAFVAALQHLPARQRAVLILREVLRWKADEVAELLGTTTASVNSALQRARATLGPGVAEGDDPDALDDDQQALLARYVDAFERYDIDLLVSLLAEDAVMSMPPYPLWLTGHEDIAWWMRGPGADCGLGSRLVPVAGNAAATLGHYRPATDGDGFEAFSLIAVDVRGQRIVSLHHFLDVDVQFPRFGLPLRLEAQ